jgi:gas vesicle protein
MKNSNIVTGIIGGLAAGVVLGILFAPDKGCNTRKKIAKKSNDLKGNLKDTFSDFLSNVESKYSNLTSKAADLTDVVLDEATENIVKINKELKR